MQENNKQQEKEVDEKEEQRKEGSDTQSKEKQQRSDPNITELKGFIDPDEKLEPKGTDNKTSL